MGGKVVGERGEFGGVAPSRFISYTVKMTRQCGTWALTSCAVRAPPRTGPSADAGADLLVEDLVPRDAVARKASSWESSSCPRAEQRARVVPSLTPASAPALVIVTDSWQAEPPTVRARVELVHGQRRMHRAWRHGEGQSGPACPDDLWGGVSSQPCVIPPVAGRPGRPRRPEALLGDKGYDSNPNRELRKRRILSVISCKGSPNIKSLGKLRSVVEQTFALRHQFKCLAVRWERRTELHDAFVSLA